MRHSVAWDPHPEIFNHHIEPPPGLLLDDRFVEGVRTICAGEVTFEDGEATGAMPGRLIRGGRRYSNAVITSSRKRR